MAVLAIVIALIASPSRAQRENTTGSIEGTVFNATNDLPVSKASVAIRGMARETLTGDDGRFYFDGVPAGEVTLRVTYLGFESQTATVTVAASQTAACDFRMRREGPAPRAPGVAEDDVVQLEKYSVVADREMTAQAIAMNEQRHAASISHILALDELPGQGNENIGDYIRFLPGVSIIDDGESPSQLSLGGFPAGMTNVSLDGGFIASTGHDDVAFSGGRELSLQDVPMMNIERVEITKVPTPDKPASGLGGSMNLVSKGLLGTRRARLDYSLTMNLATNDNLSFSGDVPQAALPSLRTARKQPSFSIKAVVPASKNLVFSAGFSKTWRQLPGGVLTETADWQLHEGRRYNYNSAQWMYGDYPIALNTATWQHRAQISSTEEIQTGMEVRLSRRDTLALAFRHREVSQEHTTNRIDITYGSPNNVAPVYNANVPAGADPATTTGNTGATGTFQQGQNAPFNYNLETTTDQFSLRYKHRGSKWKIDANASYSNAKRLRTNRDRGYVSGYGTGSNADGVGRFYVTGYGINTTDSILPTITTMTRSDGTPVSSYDADNLFLNLVRMEEYGSYVTEIYEGRLDIERIFNRHFTIKTGGAWQREERDNQRQMPTWRMKTRATGHPLAGAVFDDPRLVSYYDLIDTSIDAKIGDMPVRWISPVKVWQLTQDFPDYFQHYSNNPYEHYSNNATYTKLLREEIAAAYLRADIRLFNNRLHAVVGARYERTAVDGWVGRTDNNAMWVRDENGERIRDDVNGGYLTYPEGPELWARTYQVRALHLNNSYGDLYPSVNINLVINSNLVARAAYARTIGRPNVNDIVAGVTIPEVNDSNENAYRINISNPGLKPWTADSYHVSLDSYHFKGGFGSIGVYRKFVTNFFQQVAFEGTDADLLALGVAQSDIDGLMETGGVELVRRENIGDADLTGIEFSYRQDLFFLPSWLQKIQVWVNYTHLKVAGPNAEEFIGFAPDSFSAGINYIRPRFSLRISCAYQGETKIRRPVRTTTSSRTAYLIPAETYDYQAPHTRWGVTAEYSLSRALTLFANCNDIFADDIITYRRASNTPAYAEKYQRRVVASYVSIGIKGTF